MQVIKFGSYLITTGIFLSSSFAFGFEAGHNRALQLGPYGDSPAFFRQNTSEIEIFIGNRAVESESTTDGTKESRLLNEIEGGLAIGSVLSSEVQFNMIIKEKGKSFPGLENNSAGIPFTRSSEIKAGPTYRGEKFLIGGSVGATLLKDLKYTPDNHPADSIEIEGGLIPIAEGYFGYLFDQYQIVVGIKTYNGKEVSASYDDEDQTSNSIVISNPGEGRIDTQIQITDNLQMGISLTYYAASIGNNNLDNDDGLKELYPDGKDHISIGTGGIFQVNNETTLTGGIHYLQKSYSGDYDISEYQENTGGNRFDVGTHHWHPTGKFFFNIGYLLPHNESGARMIYSSDTEVFEEQSYQLKQSYWDINIGGTWNL
jgi:hypothetical protein